MSHTTPLADYHLIQTEKTRGIHTELTVVGTFQFKSDAIGSTLRKIIGHNNPFPCAENKILTIVCETVIGKNHALGAHFQRIYEEVYL